MTPVGRRSLQLAERRGLLVAVDLLLLTGSVVVALILWTRWDPVRFQVSPWWSETHWFLLPLLWVGVGMVTGAYDLRAPADEARVLRAVVATALGVLLV